MKKREREEGEWKRNDETETEGMRVCFKMKKLGNRDEECVLKKIMEGGGDGGRKREGGGEMEE